MQPEEQLSSEQVFNGGLVQVRVDTVLLPNGRKATREVVDHQPAVVVVPVDADGNVVLVRQYRYPVATELLEAPAGVVEKGEAPRDCAQRELQEEIGYRAGSLESLGQFWSSPGFCTELMYAYIGQDLEPSALEPDADENIEIEKVPLSTVAGLIQKGVIQDAKSIAALLMATSIVGQVPDPPAT